jgi:Major tropism determinant N-terminal domain
MVLMKFRHGTTAQWAASNPVLAEGEPGVDTTTGDLKLGNGSSSWSAIPLIYSPYSLFNSAPRGVVAVGAVYDPSPVLATEGVYLTPSMQYTFDPTRRYRAIYRVRAFSGADVGRNSGTVQFQLWNMATNTAMTVDQITSADASWYSGCVAEWLFTFNGYADIRIRTTAYNSAGTTTAYGGEFYIEDVGAYP